MIYIPALSDPAYHCLRGVIMVSHTLCYRLRQLGHVRGKERDGDATLDDYYTYRWCYAVFFASAPFQDINLLNAIYPCRLSAKKDFICTVDYLHDFVRG